MVSHSVHTKNLTKKPNIFSYLDRPVVSPDLGCRESTRGASLLLDVERNLHSKFLVNFPKSSKTKESESEYRSASPADCVRLVAPLSKRAGSLGHLEASHHYSETCGLLEEFRIRAGGPMTFQHTSPYSDNWGASAQNFSFWKNHLEKESILEEAFSPESKLLS